MYGNLAACGNRKPGSGFGLSISLAGAFTNKMLDPIFLFIFKWGMMGAAVATVIGQIVTAISAICYLCHMKTIRLSRDEFRMKCAISGRTLVLGLCSFLSQISLVAAMAAINNTGWGALFYACIGYSNSNSFRNSDCNHI